MAVRQYGRLKFNQRERCHYFSVWVGIAALLIVLCGLAIGLNRLAPLAMARWLRNALRRLAGLQAKTIRVQG